MLPSHSVFAWNAETVSIWLQDNTEIEKEIAFSFIEGIDILGFAFLMFSSTWEDIDGEALMELDISDLKGLGIAKLGCRKRYFSTLFSFFWVWLI